MYYLIALEVRGPNIEVLAGLYALTSSTFLRLQGQQTSISKSLSFYSCLLHSSFFDSPEFLVLSFPYKDSCD